MTGHSLSSLQAGRIETKMTVSELENVRSSLDTFAKDLFDRGAQFESLSKRVDSSLRNRTGNQSRTNPFQAKFLCC